MYAFVAFASVVIILVMRRFFTGELLAFMLPLTLFGALGATGYGFIAGMILFERNENTLSALIVSPLRINEYLLSKVFTLTVLACLEGTIITILSYGVKLNIGLLMLGFFILGLFYSLVGFIVVVRYTSVTDFLMTAFYYFIPLSIPMIKLLGLWESPVFYLWPTYAPVLLVQGAFYGITPADLIYSLVYASVVIIIGF